MGRWASRIGGVFGQPRSHAVASASHCRLYSGQEERTPIGSEAVVSIKEEARQLIESLPDDFSWDDLMELIYVRKTIEAGLADSEAGRTVPHEAVRHHFDRVSTGDGNYTRERDALLQGFSLDEIRSEVRCEPR